MYCIFSDYDAPEDWRDPRNNPALKRAEHGEELSVFPHREGVVLSAPYHFYEEDRNGRKFVIAAGMNPHFLYEIIN